MGWYPPGWRWHEEVGLFVPFSTFSGKSEEAVTTRLLEESGRLSKGGLRTPCVAQAAHARVNARVTRTSSRVRVSSRRVRAR